MSLKQLLRDFRFLLPFQKEPENKVWVIYFNGEVVGIYLGPDLDGLKIEHWMESYPKDPNPIQIVNMYSLYSLFI